MLKGYVLFILGFLLIGISLGAANDDWGSFENDSEAPETPEVTPSQNQSDEENSSEETPDYSERTSGEGPSDEPSGKYQGGFYLALGLGILVLVVIGFIIFSLIRPSRNKFKNRRS
jgi:hypothetical protein